MRVSDASEIRVLTTVQYAVQIGTSAFLSQEEVLQPRALARTDERTPPIRMRTTARVGLRWLDAPPWPGVGGSVARPLRESAKVLQENDICKAYAPPCPNHSLALIRAFQAQASFQMAHGTDAQAVAGPSCSTLPYPAPPPPVRPLPPRTITAGSEPVSETQTLSPETSTPSTPADRDCDNASSTLHYFLTCVRIFTACTLVTTLLSVFGWLVIAHIHARVRPTTPVYLELFFRASAAGGALLGASFALALCVFFTARHRHGSETCEVFPPLHALSSAETLLCVSVVLVGVAFSAALGMALMPDTTTDELGLHEAAAVGALCAIPGGIGLVSCACYRAWWALRRGLPGRSESARDGKTAEGSMIV